MYLQLGYYMIRSNRLESFLTNQGLALYQGNVPLD